MAIASTQMQLPGVNMTETYLRVYRDCAAFASIIKSPDQNGGLSIKNGSIAINDALVQPSHSNTTMSPPKHEVSSTSVTSKRLRDLPSVVVRRSRDATTNKNRLTLDVQLLP